MAQECMTFTLPEWPVPISTEASMGFNWGSLFAMEYEESIKEFKPILNVEYETGVELEDNKDESVGDGEEGEEEEV
jgi:hypothetical protein